MRFFFLTFTVIFLDNQKLVICLLSYSHILSDNKSQHLCSTYILTYLNLKITLGSSRHYFPHFTDGKIDALSD